jgi:hypothetical protein
VTARDLQRKDGQWTRAKGFDTFCPIGPWIDTEFDPTDALINCYVNGERRQMASSRDMVFRIPQLIAYASSIMTLEPGDLLMTGTPAGVGPLLPGDRVEVKGEPPGEPHRRSEPTKRVMHPAVPAGAAIRIMAPGGSGGPALPAVIRRFYAIMPHNTNGCGGRACPWHKEL